MKIRKNRSKVEEFIYRVEELSTKAKIPVASAYRLIYLKTGIEELREIANRIEKGESKVEVYKKYLPLPAYKILKEGEKRGIGSGHLLSQYAEYMRVYRDMKRKFSGTLLFQVIYFGVLAVAGYLLLSKVGNTLLGTKQVSDPSFYYVVKNAYIPINLLIFLTLLFTAVMPDRFPKVKEAFKEIETVRILGLTSLLYRAGSSMKDIVSFFSEDKGVGRYFTDIRDYGIEGFLKGMEKLLPPDEIAVLEISHESAQFVDGLERLAIHKLTNAQRKIDTLLKQIQIFSVVLGVIPVLFVIIGNGYLMNDILRTVLQKMQRY